MCSVGGFEEHKMTKRQPGFDFELCSLIVLDRGLIYGFIYSECWFITGDDYKSVHIISFLTSSFAFRAQLTLFRALTS